MEPVRFPGQEEDGFPATGSDDYLVFFLCSFISFYIATALLETPLVLMALRKLLCSSFATKCGFSFLCVLVILGWITTMESVMQQLVPAYFISSWGIALSSAFAGTAIFALRLFIGDSTVASRVAAALFTIVLPVEVIHYYLIGGFRKCIPMPVLYGISPIVLILFVRRHLATMGVFNICETRCPPPPQSFPCQPSRYFEDACQWADDFDSYRRLGRSEVQRLENYALKIDPDFGDYNWGSPRDLHQHCMCARRSRTSSPHHGHHHHHHHNHRKRR